MGLKFAALAQQSPLRVGICVRDQLMIAVLLLGKEPVFPLSLLFYYPHPHLKSDPYGCYILGV